ncbi:hypothetical protein [Peterkaempfera bronchialis]|uniref:hypothetical protein n=1 Tax=Peterkaempfera bronchialis TaxID=2126346 RepID=UPI001E3986D1|nr:hypothetical protein [Peterkaempfera bronchialis]
MPDNASPSYFPLQPAASSRVASNPTPAPTATQSCTKLPGCVTDHFARSTQVPLCNQFDHHGPEHTVYGPAETPILTVRRTWLAEEGCAPIIEAWGHHADLEMNQDEARSFGAQLRDQANRIDEEVDRLAAASAAQTDTDRLRIDDCGTHSWCLKGAAPHHDCEGAEITLAVGGSRNTGRDRAYLSAFLATYDGVPTCGMHLDDWTDLSAADLRQVIDDIEGYLPKLRILAAQLAVATALI